MQNNFDLIIVGGGPAGSAAAATAARLRWKVLVIDRGVEHGYLGGLGNVSYFPGFPESIGGRELIDRMRRQAELVGVHFLTDTVREASVKDASIKLVTDSGKDFEARALVVATGAALRTNYLHGEREFLGRGVSYDAASDGPSIARRVAAVIGKTKHAATEAMTLSRFAEKVHFIIPSNKIDADEKTIAELQKCPGIEMHFSTSLKKINGGDHVSSITVFTVGQEKDIPVAGVFTYVHEYQPTTGFLNKSVELSENGAVKVTNDMSTSIPRIFACGDVLCSKPQLPAIAAAQGLLAGMNAAKYLESTNAK